MADTITERDHIGDIVIRVKGPSRELINTRKVSDTTGKNT